MEVVPEERNVVLFPKHCVVAWTFPNHVRCSESPYYLEVRRPWSWVWRNVDEDWRLKFRLSKGRFRGFLLVAPYGTEEVAVRGYEGSLWRVRLRTGGAK